MRAPDRIPIPIVPARIHWANGLPRSEAFDDIYYSKSGGRAETEHVFLRGNNLRERFAAQKRFVIGELGFGTGLNFLVTLDEWLRSSRPDGELFYLAYELHPPALPDLKIALEAQLGADRLIEALLVRYPLPIEGLHVIRFEEQRATLMLNFGDADEKVGETAASVDAWYLDGFSPDKNPGLWSQSVLRAATDLSHRETTAATYSVASVVRETLTGLGWSVEKAAGIGGKRHMLRAAYQKGQPRKEFSPPSSVTILGAGIAGCSIASALQQRGVAVTVIDRHGEPAQEASGNIQAAVLPYPSAERDARHRFYSAAFLFLLNRLRELNFEWNQCGALYFPFRERQAELLKKLGEFQFPPAFLRNVSPEEAQDLSAVPIGRSGVFFPLGGALSLPELCRKLLDGSRIDKREVSCISALELRGAGALIVASGAAKELLPEAIAASITPVKGEVGMFDESAISSPLRTVLCGDGYILPALAAGDRAGSHMAGATYERGVDNTSASESGRARLDEIVQSYFSSPGRVAFHSIRAGVRATTFDRLPFAGRFSSEEQELSLSLGHGSRGAVSAPLCGEIIAAQLCAEPSPVERSVLRALDPERVLRRKLPPKGS